MSWSRYEFDDDDCHGSFLTLRSFCFCFVFLQGSHREKRNQRERSFRVWPRIKAWEKDNPCPLGDVMTEDTVTAVGIETSRSCSGVEYFRETHERRR